jgi:hypothetical protein
VGKRPPEVDRALDELVPEYRPRAEGGALERYGRLLARFAAAALLAVAAMAAIFYILHKHLKDAQTAPAPKKPVMIQIYPDQK